MGIAPKESLHYNQESNFAILAFRAGWSLKIFAQLIEFKDILTYVDTQTQHIFLKKARRLVTNPVGLITGKNVTYMVKLPLLDTHYVTLFGQYIMTLVLFCLY